MDLCRLEANADMYGLGIRLGFYLQWMARIVTDLLLAMRKCDCKRKSMIAEVEGGRFALQCFVVAFFISIIYEAASDSATVIDLYVSLLICFGHYFFFIPTFIWRITTCFDERYDPTRWLALQPSTVYNIFDHMLVLASAIFQIWFWARKVPQDSPNDCETFGFLFSKLSMKSLGFRITNLVIQPLILCIALAASVLLFWQTKRGKSKHQMGKEIEVPSRRSRQRMQLFNAFVSTCVFGSTITAIELAISWNGLNGVYSVNSTGQLIPLIISAATLGRIFGKYIWPSTQEAEERAIQDVSYRYALPIFKDEYRG